MSGAENTGADGSVTVTLTKPVMAHGEEVSSLVLRQPTVTDTLDLGMPMAIDTEGEAIIFRTAVLAKYVSRLAAVPMGTVKALALPDWLAVQGVIQGFFGRSDDTTTSDN